MRSSLGQKFNMNGVQRHRKTGFRATKTFSAVYSKHELFWTDTYFGCIFYEDISS